MLGWGWAWAWGWGWRRRAIGGERLTSARGRSRHTSRRHFVHRGSLYKPYSYLNPKSGFGDPTTEFPMGTS